MTGERSANCGSRDFKTLREKDSEKEIESLREIYTIDFTLSLLLSWCKASRETEIE